MSKESVVLLMDETMLFRLPSKQMARKFIANVVYYTVRANSPQLFTERAIVERMTKRLIHSFCRHEIYVYWQIHQARRSWDTESL